VKPLSLFNRSRLLLLALSGACGALGAGTARPALAQETPLTEGHTQSSPFFSGLNNRRTLIAQNRAFALLAERAGYGKDPVPPAQEPPANWQGWMVARYQGALLPAGREDTMDGEMTAALLYQDLLRVRLWLASPDVPTRTKALKMGGMALLYARSLDGSGGIGDKDDSFPCDELRAAICEGFLMPFLRYAPNEGPGSRRQVLESVSTIYRDLGRGDDQIQVLRLQAGTHPTQHPNRPLKNEEADMARVHLTDALLMGVPPLTEITPKEMSLAQARGYERDTWEALTTLRAVETPDLEGAKARLPEIEAQYNAIKARVAQWNVGQTPPGLVPPLPTPGTAPTGGTAGGGMAAGGGTAGAPAAGAQPQPPLIGGIAGLGTRGTGTGAETEAGAEPEEGGTTGKEDDATQARLEEEAAKADTPAGRARRALNAAQKAAAATKRAGRLSALALSLASEAAQAHQALAMARAPKGEARPLQAPVGEDGAAGEGVAGGMDEALQALAALPLPQLERRVYDASRAASDAARRADEATSLAQKATARARNLALIVQLSSNVNRAPVAVPVAAPAPGAPEVKEAR